MRARIASLVLLACAMAVGEPALAAIRTAGNGFLTVSMRDAQDAADNVGQFTISTGPAHPLPGRDLVGLASIAQLGTSYITVRDLTRGEVWLNDFTLQTSNLGGLIPRRMGLDGGSSASVTALGASGLRATYTMPSFVVVQDVVVEGDNLGTSRVRHTVSITNVTGGALSYGLRYLWDVNLDDAEGPAIRERGPDGTFATSFRLVAPSFRGFEAAAGTGASALRAYGTVQGEFRGGIPTPPSRWGYVSWLDATQAPWVFNSGAADTDGAIVYYWGYDTPEALAAGASRSFTQYLSATAHATGLSQPAAVPGPRGWALVALAGMLALAARAALRRS